MPDDILSTLPAEATRSRVIDKSQVAALIGQSQCQVDRLVKAGKLPPPFRIGERKGGWRLGTILDCLEQAEREVA